MTTETSLFIENNLALAKSLVKRYTGKGIEYDDLYQAACLGLAKAAYNFDAGKGYCFATYAVPVILGEIKQLFRSGGSVSVSRGMKELGIKVKNESESFELKYHRAPKLSELAEILGVESERIAQALCASLPVISLDEPEGTHVFENISDSTPFEDSLSESIALKQALLRLEPWEAQLIRMRYMQNQTQQKTAEMLKISQVQVSRSEKKILNKLRCILNQ